jgi:hypothetical protein
MFRTAWKLNRTTYYLRNAKSHSTFFAYQDVRSSTTKELLQRFVCISFLAKNGFRLGFQRQQNNRLVVVIKFSKPPALLGFSVLLKPTSKLQDPEKQTIQTARFWQARPVCEVCNENNHFSRRLQKTHRSPTSIASL